jgi:hypothetical protein
MQVQHLMSFFPAQEFKLQNTMTVMLGLYRIDEPHFSHGSKVYTELVIRLPLSTRHSPNLQSRDSLMQHRKESIHIVSRSTLLEAQKLRKRCSPEMVQNKLSSQIIDSAGK